MVYVRCIFCVIVPRITFSSGGLKHSENTRQRAFRAWFSPPSGGLNGRTAAPKAVPGGPHKRARRPNFFGGQWTSTAVLALTYRGTHADLKGVLLTCNGASPSLCLTYSAAGITKTPLKTHKTPKSAALALIKRRLTEWLETAQITGSRRKDGLVQILVQ